jgi:hypothetical protein
MLFLKQQHLVWVRPHERRGKRGLYPVSGHYRLVRGGKREGEGRAILPMVHAVGEEAGLSEAEAERALGVLTATHSKGFQLTHQLLQNALNATAENKGKVYIRLAPRYYEGKGWGFRFIVADEGECAPEKRLHLLPHLGANAGEVTLLLGQGKDEKGRLRFTQLKATQDQVRQSKVNTKDIALGMDRGIKLARELGIASIHRLKAIWIIDVYPTPGLTGREIDRMKNDAFEALRSIVHYSDHELTERMDILPECKRARRRLLTEVVLPNDPKTKCEVFVVRKEVPPSGATSTLNIKVLNNGLYQWSFYHTMREASVSDAHDTVVVNIKTKRTPDDPDYPWTPDYGLKDGIQKFIANAVEKVLVEKEGVAEVAEEIREREKTSGSRYVETLLQKAPPVGNTGFQLIMDEQELEWSSHEAKAVAKEIEWLTKDFLMRLDGETGLLSGLKGAVQYLTERVEELHPELQPADPKRLRNLRFYIRPAKEGPFAAYYAPDYDAVVFILPYTFQRFHHIVTTTAFHGIPKLVQASPDRSEDIVKRNAEAAVEGLVAVIAHELAHTRHLEHSLSQQIATVQIASILKESDWYKQAVEAVEKIFRKVAELAKEGWTGPPITVTMPSWAEREKILQELGGCVREMQEKHSVDYDNIFPSIAETGQRRRRR